MKSLSFAIALALALAGEANAQPYPVRPITMIVPFGAGGPTDTIARLVGERMSASLGQPIVVENVGGAAGSIGVGRAAHAPPRFEAIHEDIYRRFGFELVSIAPGTVEGRVSRIKAAIDYVQP